MSDPLTHGFRNLTRFTGRDRRGLFWPHAAIVLALTFVAMGVVMSIVMGRIFADMQAFAIAHPEAATIESSPGHYSIQVDPTHPAASMPDFGPFFATVAVSAAVAIGLLAAAVSRRLHDTGRSASWGLAPAVLLAANLATFPFVMQDFMGSETPNFTLFGLLFTGGMLYNASLLMLIVVLALPGTAGPNRHGPPASSSPP